MPDDPEAEFLHALAKAVARLVVAHEAADPEAAIVALKVLLDVIARNGTIGARKAAALTRALSSV